LRKIEDYGSKMMREIVAKIKEIMLDFEYQVA
jgi:hypothetical protein